MPRIPNQTGRSLTEMLGVLVVIGILSIAAILGYRYGIDKYRANETLQELTRRYLILNTQYNHKQTLNQDEFGSVTAQGYPIVAGLMTDQELGFYQELSNVPTGVCDQLSQSDYSAIISVNGKYLGTSDSACVDTNAIRFEYVSDTQWCVKLDDQGNCCDDKGRCCPSNKPLIDSAGKCRACEDSAQSIGLGVYAETCGRCSNRTLVGDHCVLK